MYFNISSWRKLDANLYDNGDSLIFIRKKFYATPQATIVGGIIVIISAVNIWPDFNKLNPGLILPGIMAVVGLALIIKSVQGIRERKEQGGVHQLDAIYTLDRNPAYLKRRVGDIEEQLAPMNEVNFELYKDRDKNHTHWRIRMAWPTGKETIVSTKSKEKTESLLADIRLGIAPPPAPQPPVQN